MRRWMLWMGGWMEGGPTGTLHTLLIWHGSVWWLPVVWHMSGLHLNFIVGLQTHTHVPKHHVDSTDWALMTADTSPSHPIHSFYSQLLSFLHFNFFIHILPLFHVLPFISLLPLSVTHTVAGFSLVFQPASRTHEQVSPGNRLIYTNRTECD